MNEEEFDVVEFTDEDGNQLLLEVVDSFFYNGNEFAVLTEWEACDCEHECECGCEGHTHGDGHIHGDHGKDPADDEEEQNLYIMKIESFVNDDGEEMEEFVPVEDSLMETLIEIVQTRFSDDDDEEDEDDDEDDEDDDDEDDDDEDDDDEDEDMND